MVRSHLVGAIQSHLIVALGSPDAITHTGLEVLQRETLDNEVLLGHARWVESSSSINPISSIHSISSFQTLAELLLGRFLW